MCSGQSQEVVLPGVDVGPRACEELLAGSRAVDMEACLGRDRANGLPARSVDIDSVQNGTFLFWAA